MSTNFFQNQARARQATGYLVFLFILAVIAVILSMNATMYFILAFQRLDADTGPVMSETAFATVTILTLLVIGLTALIRLSQLSGGGHSVASLLGGMPVNPDTEDPQERKLLNVVEEMAIASGIPVPPVYMMDESSINAFAAGRQPTDAVIGVTKGTVENLNRDELQGVIAHEFSHIFNGDMRLNLNLIGVLAGIQAIGSIGLQILRGLGESRSSSRKNDGKAAIIILGLAMTVIGYVGVFFASLIKSAISRQREFLADASAVQYTRNPLGIGGALKKIGKGAFSSRIAYKNAGEMSHMFFGQAVSSLFSTHPPIEERIKRIDPNILRDDSERALPAEPEPKQTKSDGRQKQVLNTILAGEAIGPDVTISRLNVMESIGNASPRQLKGARNFLATLPGEVSRAAHVPSGAQALICALLTKDPESAPAKVIAEKGGAEIFAEYGNLLPLLEELGPSARLPLVELSIPTLRRLSVDEKNGFLRLVKDVIWADQRCEMFEYVIFTVLQQQLAKRSPHSNARRLSHHTQEAALVLSAIAHAGREANDPRVTGAFNSGAAILMAGTEAKNLPLSNRELCDAAALERVLRSLAELNIPSKKTFVEACVAAVVADDRVSVDEYELLHAVCTVLAVPLPPIGLPVSV